MRSSLSLRCTTNWDFRSRNTIGLNKWCQLQKKQNDPKIYSFVSVSLSCHQKTSLNLLIPTLFCSCYFVLYLDLLGIAWICLVNQQILVFHTWNCLDLLGFAWIWLVFPQLSPCAVMTSMCDHRVCTQWDGRANVVWDNPKGLHNIARPLCTTLVDNIGSNHPDARLRSYGQYSP